MILTQLAGKQRILLLQGPMGRFFAELSGYLRAAGKYVFKVNFNAGDRYFFPDGTPYRGRLADWPAWLEIYCREQRIDAIVVFGDCRAYHRMAREVARDLELGFLVFEEGYLRPNWITMEHWGVNGHTSVPRDPTVFARISPEQIKAADAVQPVADVQNSYFFRAMLSIWYFLLTWFGSPWYWNYQHHRRIAWSEAYRWIRGGVRKLWYGWRQRHVLPELLARYDRHFYLFPLQVHNDSQLWFHAGSPMSCYIDDVIHSFAEHAPDDSVLVIKHHPMDRAYRDYSAHIDRVARQAGVAARVRYVHDLHLPTLLNHARGVVTVNSTVGFTAVLRGLPVKTLGKALYSLPGLTHQGTLSSFWTSGQAPDAHFARQFRAYLVHTNQLRGCVYARNPLVDPRIKGITAVSAARSRRQRQRVRATS